MDTPTNSAFLGHSVYQARAGEGGGGGGGGALRDQASAPFFKSATLRQIAMINQNAFDL